MANPDPAFRKMKNGDIVVDYGAVWYRIKADGAIVKRTGSASGVETTIATRKEAELVRNDLKIWDAEK
jgi:hypothetical protein